MSHPTLLEIADDVVARARKRGADQCEAWAESVTSTTVSIEQNEVKGASSSEHAAIGIRVIVGKRLGFAYVNHLASDALQEAIDDALAIARASDEDPANDLVEPRPLRPIGGLWDDALAHLPPDACVALAGEMVSAARAVDKRVSIDSGSFAASHGSVAISTSKGVRATERDVAATYGLFGFAVDGDEVGSFDHVFEASRQRDGIDVRDVGRRFGEQVIALLHPRNGRSYRGRVLFSPEAFEEIYLQALLGALDGDAVLKGKSRLADRLGQRVASEGFVVVDDGTLPGGIGSSMFDREGLPHRRTVLVGDGILHKFLYDARTARRAGRQPTGHAEGSARSLPSVGTTNLRVGPGDVDDHELFAALGDGLYVGRFSGDVDPVSGDFSGVAKGSFLVRKGNRAEPVRETLIAGNAFDGLTRIVARGKHLHVNMATSCPLVLVDGIDVTAGRG